ncbi:MAG: type II 3-dehydroquinate dehydratase [Pseudomonadota bacterium]
MARVLVLNGPNLDRLGKREPEIYGSDTLSDIQQRLDRLAGELDLDLTHAQSNAEHELIEHIHAAADAGCRFLLLNPGGFTHTSVALRDAVLASELQLIEVHLSNPDAREPFRRTNYFSDIAVGRVAGFGAQGYELALRAAANLARTTA